MMFHFILFIYFLASFLEGALFIFCLLDLPPLASVFPVRLSYLPKKWKEK